MNKKITLLLVILLALVGFSVYFFFFTGNGGTAIKNAQNFLPFGQNNTEPVSGGTAVAPPDNSNQPVEVSTTTESALPRLREISNEPVAGFTTLKDGSIRYIERGTGNIFETKTTSLNVARLTNTTYSRIQEAFFLNSGKSVVIRSLGDADVVKTYLADIVAPTNTGTSTDTSIGSLRGDYIDDNISFFDVSPDTTRMFVLREGVTGATGFIADNKAQKPKLVFTSKLGEWLPQWYGKDDIAMTTKPTNGLAGILLLIHTKTGTTERLLANVQGLTALVNPTGSEVLFSESTSGIPLTFNLYNKKTNATITLDQETFPEKCVWSQKEDSAYCLVPKTLSAGTYPDDWYQGVQSFTDAIWKFDMKAQVSVNLFDPTTIKVAIDGIRPALTLDEKYLLFINKKDGSLWSYQITE